MNGERIDALAEDWSDDFNQAVAEYLRWEEKVVQLLAPGVFPSLAAIVQPLQPITVIFTTALGAKLFPLDGLSSGKCLVKKYLICVGTF